MIASLEDLRTILKLVFPEQVPPKPLHLVEPAILVREGALPAPEAARQAGATAKGVIQLAASPVPLSELLGVDVTWPSPFEPRAQRSLGQLLIGAIAEQVFEEFYRTTVGTTDLQLKDDRTTRGDTDYLVFNGSGRQVFRINIKFHGSVFRRAVELVGLDPSDCFPLATYKIYSALRKQETETLPYIFVIVGVPGLTGDLVGASIPEDLIHLTSLAYASPRITGVRTIEDQIVSRLATDPGAFGFQLPRDTYLEQIRQAQWLVLSARKAHNLLRDMLFERAYALRVRAFARNYARAELDMHFSMTSDLRPLSEFLRVLHDQGMAGLATHLERGLL